MFNKNKIVNNVIKFFTTKLDKKADLNNSSSAFNFFKMEKKQTKTTEIQKKQGLETSREVNIPQEMKSISQKTNTNILLSSTPDIAVKDSEETTSETQEEQKKLTTQTHQTTNSQFERRMTNLLLAIPQKVEDGTATWVERSMQKFSDKMEEKETELKDMTFLDKTKFVGLMLLFIMQNRYRLR